MNRSSGRGTRVRGQGNGRGTRRGDPGREEVTQAEAPTKQEVNEPTPSTANARSQRRLVQEELYKNMAMEASRTAQ
jgi:hypothetical protein